jgi:hypothetical protein
MTVDEFIAWAGGYTLTRHPRERGSPCHVVTERTIVPRVRSRSNMRVPASW